MREHIHRFTEAREGLCGGVGTEEGGRMSGKRWAHTHRSMPGREGGTTPQVVVGHKEGNETER